MKHARKLTVGLLVLCAFALLSRPADAQTTASGPYYATPSWDQTLPSATRFIVLSNFASAAVLDRETGLVWERAPLSPCLSILCSGGIDPGTRSWDDARNFCANKNVGGRRGWRLPSINELASLIDPSVPSPGPTLPAGHPFTNVQSSIYWSATTDAGFLSHAWGVGLNLGDVGADSKTNADFVWCVRGGGVMDNY